MARGLPADEDDVASHPTVPIARRWRLVRAPEAAIPASVRRFNARARARRFRSARPWAIAVLVLIAAGAAGWLFYVSSVFGVDRIAVSGSGFVGDAAVRSAADVRLGTPLARINERAVGARIEKLPGVRIARVHTRWPSTLVIDVTTRTAIAAAPTGTSFVLLDASGVAFQTVSARPDLPVISLLSPGPNDLSTRAALTVLTSLPEGIREQLVSMAVPSSVDISLSLADHRTVIWGDSSDNAEKGRVALSLLLRSGTVIDVSAPNVVTVK